jgi:hypothetical protein
MLLFSTVYFLLILSLASVSIGYLKTIAAVIAFFGFQVYAVEAIYTLWLVETVNEHDPSRHYPYKWIALLKLLVGISFLLTLVPFFW